MQYKRRGTKCNLLARHSDSASASLPMRRHHAKSIVVVLVVSLLLLRPSPSRRWLLREPSIRCLEPPFCNMLVKGSSEECMHRTLLKVVPSPHSDLAAVKFTLVLQACLLCLLASRLTSITPAEVIKFPERVRWEYKIPDGQREQVDKHPCHIGPSVGGDHDQDRWETQDQCKKHKWYDRRCCV